MAEMRLQQDDAAAQCDGTNLVRYDAFRVTMPSIKTSISSTLDDPLGIESLRSTCHFPDGLSHGCFLIETLAHTSISSRMSVPTDYEEAREGEVKCG